MATFMTNIFLCCCYHSQVQSLDTEASRLATSYPGPQAHDINSKQEEVSSAWDELQARSMLRRNRLRAALELQKLNNSVSTVYG